MFYSHLTINNETDVFEWDETFHLFLSPASEPFIIHVTRAGGRQRTELSHCLTPIVLTAPVSSRENESLPGPGVLFYT